MKTGLLGAEQSRGFLKGLRPFQAWQGILGKGWGEEAGEISSLGERFEPQLLPLQSVCFPVFVKKKKNKHRNRNENAFNGLISRLDMTEGKNL